MPIQNELRETFESSVTSNSQNWWIANGGVAKSSVCGTLASGMSMEFSGSPGGRRLITADINTTNAAVLNFYLMNYSPYCNQPTSTTQGIVVGYSVDGGITFKQMTTYSYTAYAAPNELSLYIPLDGRVSAARFMFWQPANGGSGNSLWVCKSRCFVFELDTF
jgi:hypothetical protein